MTLMWPSKLLTWMSLRESWEIRLNPSRVRVPLSVLILLRASLPLIWNASKPPILSWLHMPPSKVMLISPPLSSNVFTALPVNWLGLLCARPRPILITDGCCRIAGAFKFTFRTYCKHIAIRTKPCCRPRAREGHCR